MDFIEIKIRCSDIYRDLVVFELSSIGDITFIENPESLDASYPNNQKLHKKIVEKLDYFSKQLKEFNYTYDFIRKQNWNQQWEQNYQAVVIAEKFTISAPFHKTKKHDAHQIIIHPAMAFGTGHHATTKMMVELMEKIDFQNKTVADFGCGTSLLAIIAEKKGASSILAFDNDIESVKSSKENIKLNDCQRITIKKGSANLLKSQSYDIILANITLNILLKYKKILGEQLKPSGYLICSGFRNDDKSIMKSEFLKLSLFSQKMLSENEWSAILMQKKIAIHEK